MNNVQKYELEILKEIIKVCDSHKLKYFAIGGTCIGAIRHKGFIPWDDDIDIALPRKDYELFRQKFYQQLPSYLSKLDCDNSYGNYQLFTKIYDNRTTFIEDYNIISPTRYTGVFVDVMPIDNLPDDYRKQKKAINKYNNYLLLNEWVRPRSYELSGAKDKIKEPIKHILRFIFKNKFNHFSDKVRMLSNSFGANDNSEKVYFTWRPKRDCSLKRRVFERCYFDEILKVPFEDTFINVPKEYNRYLTQDFGDYMQMPSIDQRKSLHTVLICDLNTPVSFYREMKEMGKNPIEVYKEIGK